MSASRSRVARIEAGDPSVSLDLIMRAFFAACATRRELQRAFGAGEKVAAYGNKSLTLDVARCFLTVDA